MQLVIEISEDVIKCAKSSPNYYPTYLFEMIWKAIANGTQLPKGHGRIGDLTKLYNEIDTRNKGKDKGKYTGILALVGFADTIIEADKEGDK